MSLIWTESFMGFKRHNGPMGANTAAETMAALQAAGYTTFLASTGANYGLAISDDPVVPERAGLRVNNSTTMSGLVQVVARELPPTLHPIIFGFSLFIPSSFVPASGGAATVLQVGLHPKGATDLGTLHNTAERVAFRIGTNLGIYAGGQSNPQSQMRPAPGKTSYFEVRFDGTQVSVWMDDALVIQNETVEQAGMISFGFGSQTPYQPQDWALGNIYILSQDDVAPNVRLGPTTRVIGRRPAEDVRTDFLRPAAFASNAAVAAQDITSTPDHTLQSTSVGDTDIYDAGVDSDTASAGIVHAVSLKVMAANLEVAPHELKTLILSDSEESDEEGALVMQQIPNFTSRTLNFIIEHPTKGLIAGGNGEALYCSTDDGETWTQISETGSTVHYNHGVFSSNGNGVILRSDGGVMYCHDSSPIDEWQYAASGVAYDFKRIAANGDTFFMVGNGSSSHHRKLTYPKDGPLTFGASGMVGALRYDVAYDNGTWLAVGITNAVVMSRSEDNGASWAQLDTGLSSSGAALRRFAFGNGTWLMVSTGQTSVYNLFRSVDNGLTWVDVTTAISNSYRHITEMKFADGLFIAVGFGRANAVTLTEGVLIATSPDGINWKYYPRLKLGNVANACANGLLISKTGRLIVVGTSGDVFISKPIGQVKPLPVMGGYQLLYSPASKDPATGLPWAPEAAAASQFGMRVES